MHFATQAVMSGTSDVVIAGGVQNMNMIPISFAMTAGQQLGFDTPFNTSPGWNKRYGDVEVSQFNSAHMIAEKWNISREEMELFAFNSHQKAISAIESGIFKNEIITPGIQIGKRNYDQKRSMEAKKVESDWLVIGRAITQGNIKKNIQNLINHLSQ